MQQAKEILKLLKNLKNMHVSFSGKSSFVLWN